jgi:hypothetical protein
MDNVANPINQMTYEQHDDTEWMVAVRERDRRRRPRGPNGRRMNNELGEVLRATRATNSVRRWTMNQIRSVQ